MKITLPIPVPPGSGSSVEPAAPHPVPAGPDPAGADLPAERRNVQRDVHTLNRAAEVLNSTLKFTVTDSHRIIIKVIDATSGEVLREIPPERLVQALEQLESAMSVLMDRKV